MADARRYGKSIYRMYAVAAALSEAAFAGVPCMHEYDFYLYKLRNCEVIAPSYAITIPMRAS